MSWTKSKFNELIFIAIALFTGGGRLESMAAHSPAEIPKSVKVASQTVSLRSGVSLVFPLAAARRKRKRRKRIETISALVAWAQKRMVTSPNARPQNAHLGPKAWVMVPLVSHWPHVYQFACVCIFDLTLVTF